MFLDTENSDLIFFGNQLTGIYVRRTLFINELNDTQEK